MTAKKEISRSGTAIYMMWDKYKYAVGQDALFREVKP